MSIHDYRDPTPLNAWHELVEQQHALAPEDMLKESTVVPGDNARNPDVPVNTPQAISP